MHRWQHRLCLETTSPCDHSPVSPSLSLNLYQLHIPSPPPPSIPHLPPPSIAGEQLLDLFSHVPTTVANFDLIKEAPTVGEVAMKVAIVSSQRKPTALDLCACAQAKPHAVSCIHV